jgi:hypothetical protein
LVAAVRKLIDAPEARAVLVARGREHAEIHHSLRNAKVLAGLLLAAGNRPCVALKSPS